MWGRLTEVHDASSDFERQLRRFRPTEGSPAEAYAASTAGVFDEVCWLPIQRRRERLPSIPIMLCVVSVWTPSLDGFV